MKQQVQNSLTEKEAAEILKVSPKTLQGWRWMRKGPAYVKYVRTIRYLAADLAAYQEKTRIKFER